MKIKRTLLLTLTLIMSFCMLFLVGCKREDIEIEFKEQRAVYRVGESIDLKDLIEQKEGVTYSFSYSIDGGEIVEVESRAIFARKAGEYTINCSAKNDNGGEGKNTTTISVYEQEPLMFIKNTTYPFNYLQKIYLEKLVPTYDMFYDSESEYEFIIDYCHHYKNPYITEGVKIEFGDEKSSGEYEGLYDGNGSITFIKEGKYEFHLIMRNAGGEIDDTFTVTVRESFKTLSDLLNDEKYEGYELTYDIGTGIAQWTPFTGASWYKVKVDYETVYTQNTYLDIRPYLVEEAKGFQCFDFTVIPLDENKELYITPEDVEYNSTVKKESDKIKGYKYEIANFVIAPKACGQAVLSKGTSVSEKDGVYTASLLGGKSRSKGWSTGVNYLDNNYVAWRGNYGIGIYLEFTFKGNNMPNLMFFADEVNGNMSMGSESDPYKGVYINNGMYCAIVDTSYQLFSADRITVWGPNRFYGSSSSTSKTWSGMSEDGSVNYRIAHELNYPEFTQNYLISQAETEFKYIVGTYEKSGLLWINMALYEKESGKEISVANIKTTLSADKVEAGNIIAYASVKVDAEDSQFTFKAPFESEPITGSIYLGKYITANSVTLTGVRPVNSQGNKGVGAVGSIGVQDSYLAFKGNYGVGNYVEFEFSGNNMPYLNLFADSIDGWLGYTGATVVDDVTVGVAGKGIVIINGIVDQGNQRTDDTVNREIRCDEYNVWGPNRYTTTNQEGKDMADHKPLLSLSYNDYPLLTQKGLNEDTSGRTYRYKVGTYYDLIGNLVLHVTLSDASNNDIIYNIEEILEIGNVDIGTGNIIALAPMKGFGNDTSFKFKSPEQEQSSTKPQTCAYGATANSNGTVTLTGVRPVNSQGTKGVGAVGSIGVQDSYLAFSGDYGVGNYIEFEFSGNNMPYLNLFADTIDGWLGIPNSDGTTGKGIVIINGIVDKGNQTADDTVNREVRCEEYNVWGPSRYTTTNQAGADMTDHKPLLSLSYNDYPLLTQKGLNEDASGRTYKYKVGTYYDVIGNLILNVTLADASNNDIIYNIEEILDIGNIDIGTGNIIALASMKGLGNDTTFKFSNPVQEQSSVKPQVCASGAIVNSDGTATLAGVQANNGLGGSMRLVSNSYIGFGAQYGLNTYVDFYYTGNNMPQVTFFANEIDGCMNYQYGSGDSAVKKYGILLLNGLVTTNSTNGTGDSHAFGDELRIFGPNKYDVNNSYNGTTGARVKIEDYPELTQDGCVSERKYKYTVGTYEGENNLIYVDLTLSYLDGTEYVQLYHVEQSTTLTVEEMKAVLGITEGDLEGKIIAYAVMKGAGNDTTFSFGQPYQSQQGE